MKFNPRFAFAWVLNEVLSLFLPIRWVPNEEPVTWLDWVGLGVLCFFLVGLVYKVVQLIAGG